MENVLDVVGWVGLTLTTYDIVREVSAVISLWGGMREAIDHYKLLAARRLLKTQVVVRGKNSCAWLANTSSGYFPEQIAMIAQISRLVHEINPFKNGLLGLRDECGDFVRL